MGPSRGVTSTVALIGSGRLFPLKLSWFASQLPDFQGSLMRDWLHAAGSSHYSLFGGRSAPTLTQ